MKLKVFIHAQYDEYDKVFNYHAWSQDMSSQPSCGPLVATTEVEFTPPPYTALVNGTVAKWREEQKQVRAAAESRVNIIEERIQDLLCLEYKPL